MDDVLRIMLASALLATGAIGLAYRVYRWRLKGPIGDVWGQAVLAIFLGALALAVAQDLSWARWVAVGFGVLFAAVVMPLWVLAVLIPLRPGPIDVGFTAFYWLLLFAIVVAGIAA